MREQVHIWFRVTVRWAFMPFALLAGLFASADASAQDYAMRDVGGWTVAASKDKDGCFLTRTYGGAGETTLLLGIDIDGSNHLSVLNSNWSIKQMDRLKLNFRLSTGGYSRQLVVGMESAGKKGFVTSFETKFPSYFAASKALHIYRGDVPVEQLNLDGSGAAVAELRRCVDIYRAKPVAGGREKGRSDQIPRDPFAPDAGRKSEDPAGER
ncbi:hypothetical protein [Sphingomonas alpina]|uniref:Uncharacterized protein n=1 Tax=Sphingomonas alpina TaxID=653931 RepID=A0A7H0LM09_9SPHN|nr:hypothetical protein [Sphingomonas alpina]QNQ10712.1 hypothetical protein H3Z74_05815 [Sphingomonas alpina]